VKIFISSSRKGLEDERNALDGLIRALGHTPVRFEDFSAQTNPSREACLKALGSADACLFLLGPYYGHLFPETGQSATHDEWMAAQASGMTKIVYRKLGITFEPEQHKFTRIVEAYATGVFRDSFSTTTELMTKVTKKIREMESSESPLSYSRLTRQPDLKRTLGEVNPQAFDNQASALELSILPLEFVGYSARELRGLGDSLPERIRATKIVSSEISLTPTRSDEYAGTTITSSLPRSWNNSHQGELRELRLYKTGQLTAQASLPWDSLGSILDPVDLIKQIADLLKFAGALNIVKDERIVVAAGVQSSTMLSVDTFDPQQSRRSAQAIRFGNSSDPLRTEPDESVTLAALGAGAREIAAHLAQTLISQARGW
jgi:hypothetical protein